MDYSNERASLESAMRLPVAALIFSILRLAGAQDTTILPIIPQPAAEGQSCSGAQIAEATLGVDEGFSAREWFLDRYSQKFHNILHPLDRRNSQLKRVMIDVEIDGQDFELIFDTGSQLTWVPAKNITLDSKYKKLRFQSYYEPIDGQPRQRFRREYGVQEVRSTVSGREYYGPFASSRCAINMTYGVADYFKFNSVHFAAVFGASKRGDHEDPFSMIEEPATRHIFEHPVFTVALKPWREYEFYEPRRPEMGSVEFGGFNSHHCSPEIAYSRPFGTTMWRMEIGKIFFGFSRNASHDFHPNGFAKEIPFDAKDAALDSGSPGISLPDSLFSEIAVQLPHGYMPKFRCNDSEIRAELHIQMAEPPFHTVKMDLRHLVEPDYPGSDQCSLKMIPTSSEIILGLPFYAAAGCIVHDYIQRRVGISVLRNSSAVSNRMWKRNKANVNSFGLKY